MNSKDLLIQYENDLRREKRLKEFIDSQRTMIDSLDLVPGQTTKQMKKDLSSFEKDLSLKSKQLIELTNERQKISDLISEIPGLEGKVLTRRYVNGEIWEDICESMFYSWSYVHKLHRRGLQIVQDRLDQGLFEW